jgi:hypothetical protein
VDVQSGGTLGGVGQFGNITLESGGMFAPGNSIGTVEASVFIWNGGGRFVFELGATTNDLLNVVALLKGSGSSFTFDFVNAGWQVGHTYTLIDFDVSGFAASDFGYSNGGDFNGIFAYNGSALTFQLVAIPEPSSCALVFAGFLTVLVVIRRRGAHSN